MIETKEIKNESKKVGRPPKTEQSIRVKMFQGYIKPNDPDLVMESVVNSWLDENKVELIDIKMNQSYSPNNKIGIVLVTLLYKAMG